MHTMSNAVSSTAAVTSGRGAATVPAASNGDAASTFASLLQYVGGGPAINVDPIALLDPALVQTPAPSAPAPQAPQPQQQNNAANGNNNNTSNNTSSNKNTSNQSANSNSSDTTSSAVTDPTLATQLSLLQVQVSTLNRPVTVAKSATTTDGTTTQNAPVATAPTSSAAGQTTTQTGPAVSTPVANLLQAQTTADAQSAAQNTAPVTTTTQAAPTTTTPVEVFVSPFARQTTVTTTSTANTANAQNAQADAASTPAPTAPAASATAPTPVAQGQSQALSQLLAQNDQARVSVATPAATQQSSSDPYNIYSGYPSAVQVALSEATADATPQDDAASVAAQTPVDQPNVAPPVLAAAAAIIQSTGGSAATGTTAVTTPTIANVAATGNAVVAAEAQHGTQDFQGDFTQGSFGQSNTGSTGNTTGTTATSSSQAASQPTTTQQVFDQIKVSIAKAANAGQDQVTIALRPAELGRVEIKLQVDDSGKVHAMVTADKPETLQLLQSDSKGLEQALTDAGLQADTGSLEFSLRGDSNAQQQTADTSSSGATTGAAIEDTAFMDDGYDYASAAAQRGGVDTLA